MELPKRPTRDVDEAISHFSLPGIDKIINVRSIVSSVAKVSGISVKKMKAINRKQTTVVPRQISMYMLRKYMPEISLSEIGRIMSNPGNKQYDHATVLHSINCINLRRDQSVEFDNRCRTIEAVITGAYDFRTYTEAGANTAKLQKLIDNVSKNKGFINDLLSQPEDFHIDQIEEYRDVLRDYLGYISERCARVRQKGWKNKQKL